MKIFLILISSLCFLVITSCSDFSNLMDDYNSNFSFNENAEVEEETTILSNQYNVYVDCGFAISAPEGYDSYEWSIDGVELPSATVLNTSYFHIYIPDTSLEAGKGYVIRLKIYSGSDTVNEETADLYVFDYS
ncbi:MAG: hypothetical protein K6F69_10410 [Treponema sp.]|nr:hypothetical protein [Treponema sp.]